MNAFADRASPLRRASLHEELAGKLRGLIETGELEAGRKVPERELCEAYGVSRTPLREALKVLASERLVSLEPNRGAWVTPITRADVEEIYPIMGAFEALAGELACERLSDEGVAGIRALHETMLERYRAGDREGFFAANEGIHEAILAGAGNGTLAAQYRSLAARVRRVRYVARMSDAQWARAVEEHEEMIRRLEARDGTGLARVLRAHLAAKAEIVLDWLDGEPGAGGGQA
jgi:DNA-binding GntR family transcriptional regulator